MHRKRKGFANIMVILLLYLILCILLFSVDRYLTNAKARKVQTDILLSNLATYGEIDLKLLGKMPQIFSIKSPTNSFMIFKTYLEKNMELDSSLNALDSSMVVGKVTVESYIVYNVTGNKVETYTCDTFNNTFSLNTVADYTLTQVKSPNGVTITKTSIYTKIQYFIQPLMKGIVGDKVPLEAEATTDINK